MDGQHLYAILSLAFGLGMLHALDADHIMAVSGLASTRPTFANCLRFCAKWAMGHGLTLFVIGFAVFVLGYAIPEELSRISEHMVGVLLIFIGAWVLWDIHRQRSHFHFHQHDNLPQHAHWHRHKQAQKHNEKAHKHEHSAVMVGILHGAAGSAPLLAIIPLSQYSSPLYTLLYLILFALGVLVSMLIFGGVLSGIYTCLAKKGKSLILGLRFSIGCSALIMGSVLLYSGLTG